MKISGKWFLVGILLAFILDMLRPVDPTDKSKWDRSGMSFYIDHGTGCHYLAGGGLLGKKVLIPRVDKEGNHICD